MQGDESDLWSAPALSQPAADEVGRAPLRSASSGLHAGDAVDPAGRYRVLSVLGRGGMGEVVLADDTVLGRQVAIKTSLISGAAMERLLSEATLTALLEHAAVVPVYDAGRRSDGTPFYVMRVIRGRTLADAVGALRHPEQDSGPRVALCRHVLEAARAVAFAHRLGVVHRDLKPANLLIGEQGETQVADWGLAATLEAARGAGVVGSRGFVAPEIERGGDAGLATDVYALGATLAFVLAAPRPGREAPSSAGSQSDSATRRQAVCSDERLPADLRAIVACAMADAPAARYQDASAFAADLDAFLSGRRVVAHSYTRVELARRFWDQFRLPITLVVIAIALAMVAVSMGWWRSVRERDRATAAELRAQAAARDADVQLARLHGEQAQLAALYQRRAEAEVLAESSLRRQPSDGGRGVLAAFAASPRPRWLGTTDFAPCRPVAVARDGKAWACLQGGGVRYGRAGATGRLLAGTPSSLGLEPHHGLLLVARTLDRLEAYGLDDGLLRWGRAGLGGGALALGADAAIANRRNKAIVFDPLHGTERAQLACRDGLAISAVAIDAAGTAAAAVCPDGGDLRGVAVWQRVGGVRFLPAAVSSRGVSAAALHEDGRTLLLAQLDNALQAVDLADGATRSLGVVDVRDVDGIAVRGPLLALHAGNGGASVRRISDGAALFQVPGSGDVALAFEAGGDLLALGTARARWQPPPAPRPFVLGTGAGIAAVEVAPGGQRLLLGRGDGVAEEFAIGDGTLQRRQVVCSGPVKQFAFEPGGGHVQIVCSGSPGVGRWRWPSLVAEPRSHDRAGRRMGVLRSGTRWLLDSIQSVVVEPPAQLGRQLRQLGPGFLDGATCTGGRVALLTGGRDQLWRLDDATATEPVRLRPIAAAPASMAVTCGEAVSAFGDAASFAIADLAGVRRLEIRPEAPRLLRLQLSPDDALVASGHLDGRVLVFRSRDGLLLATLRGHAERVSSLAFAERRLLVTGSWDGTARLYGLDELETPASALNSGWPLTVEAASAAVSVVARPSAFVGP